MAKAKNNYLNNRDLLAEIHKSKNSYCYYIGEEYAHYDIIIQSVEMITEEIILKAKQNRVDKTNKKRKEEDKNYTPITLDEVLDAELVFRVMNDDHIPDEIKKNKKVKNNPLKGKVVKLNFNPFKHFIVTEFGLKEVGRSHWTNGLENGEFSLNHGRLTDKLALMFVKLVERYSQKGNWRGYTWLDDMRSQAVMHLVETALKFDESKSDNAFSYYTCIVTNSFRGMLNSENKVATIKNKIMIESGYDPSFDYQIDYERENN